MKISTPCVVALTWTLMDTLDEVLDTLDEPIEFFVGGDDLLPKIEEALQGLKVGADIRLHLEPEHAFGDYNEELVFLETRNLFGDGGKDLEEGMVIAAETLPEGCSSDMPMGLFYTISDLYPEHVVLDGNHPLAGMALRLQLQVCNVRAATELEQKQRTLGVGFFSVSS